MFIWYDDARNVALSEIAHYEYLQALCDKFENDDDLFELFLEQHHTLVEVFYSSESGRARLRTEFITWADMKALASDEYRMIRVQEGEAEREEGD